MAKSSNIASYVVLTPTMAEVRGVQAVGFARTPGEPHIHFNHIDQIPAQFAREPRVLPVVKINPAVRDIFGFRYQVFSPGRLRSSAGRPGSGGGLMGRIQTR